MMKGVQQKSSALKVAISLSLLAFILQIVGAIYTRSVSLLGDSAHLFTDLFSLGLALWALSLAKIPKNKDWNFGMYRAEILAAFVNALLLILVALSLLYESALRFFMPKEVMALPLIYFAVIGLVLNLLSAWVLSRSLRKHSCGEIVHHHSHGQKGVQSALLHVLSDAASSALVVVCGLTIYFTNWIVIDSILGVLLSLFIFRWAWQLMRENSRILLEGRPPQINYDQILANLSQLEEIQSVESLYCWEISTENYFGMVGLHTASNKNRYGLRVKIEKIFQSQNIHHVNIDFLNSN